MRNRLLKILLPSALLPSIFACTINADTTTAPSSKEQTPLSKELAAEAFLGRWSHDCENAKGITITNIKNISIEVNNNQIYINAFGTRKGRTLTIFLNEPEDLGRGGMMLDWPNFSKEKPIAGLDLKSDRSANLTWNGFFNEEKNNYEWIDEPDFAEKKNPIILKKCSE